MWEKGKTMTVKEIYEKAEWKLDHNEITIGEFEKLVDVDVVERKRGEWIPCTKQGLALSEMMRIEGKKWYGYKCSQCNFIYKGCALTQSPYCQRCGADMRGVE